MELVGYEETLLSAKHSVEFFDDFEDWTRIEAEEETPTFENFQVRANQALTEKWMSAEIAWSKESSIVAVDKLESNWVKTDGLPRNKISQLVNVPLLIPHSNQPQTTDVNIDCSMPTLESFLLMILIING